MEPIDAAHARFSDLVKEVGSYIHSVDTEADTRLKVIDRILMEVLLWPHREIYAEAKADTGFADYGLAVDSRMRLIVEAKRDGRSLGCEGRHAKRGYKLSGGSFRDEAAKEGIAQAIRYCGEKNAELACVTNGREWIIFRGNRLGDGRDTREGVAFVFSNLVEIEEHFNLFYNLLSYESARDITYRPYFQEAEGQPIRMTVFHKAVRPQGSARFIPSGELSSDVSKLMTTFFQRLTGDEDPDLLEACFVETHESMYADTQLARIAQEVVTKIRGLDTAHGDDLVDLIRRVTETRRNEFVVLVGTKGAGKSTFVTRFFTTVLPPDVAGDCVTIKVDLAKSTGQTVDLAGWLDEVLLQEAERQIFQGEPPSLNDLTGIFYDEYTRLKKGQWAAIYDRDHQEFLAKFGTWLEDQRQYRPHEYLEGLLRNIVTMRGKLPVVVFDNTDHFSILFQQLVYQYARSLFEAVICLVILPITDRTSWQLSKHGAMQSFEYESFFLPTPPTDAIIRKRIEFLEHRIEAERARPDDRYFVKRGISLNLSDLTGFTRTLQRVFVQTSHIADSIGNLANHDVRRTLTLAKEFVGSPHLNVEQLIKAYVARSAVDLPEHLATRALVCGHYDVYPTGNHDFVQNLFSLDEHLETTPLLGLRLLRLLADVPVDEHLGQLIDVEQVMGYAAGMGIEARATGLWLDGMLKTGLCLNFDPTVVDIDLARQIEISPAGRQHLLWGSGDFEYLTGMAAVTPLLDEPTFMDLQRKAASKRWRSVAATFAEYLLREDASYCSAPKHEAYASQQRLITSLTGKAERWAQPKAAPR